MSTLLHVARFTLTALLVATLPIWGLPYVAWNVVADMVAEWF